MDLFYIGTAEMKEYSVSEFINHLGDEEFRRYYWSESETLHIFVVILAEFLRFLLVDKERLNIILL